MTSSLVDKSIREHGSVSAEDEEIFKDVTGVAYAGEQFLLQSFRSRRH